MNGAGAAAGVVAMGATGIAGLAATGAIGVFVAAGAGAAGTTDGATGATGMTVSAQGASIVFVHPHSSALYVTVVVDIGVVGRAL